MRRIDHVPAIQYFIPSEKCGGNSQNTLKLEELEAIRLKDLKGWNKASVEKMGVSGQPSSVFSWLQEKNC